MENAQKWGCHQTFYNVQVQHSSLLKSIKLKTAIVLWLRNPSLHNFTDYCNIFSVCFEYPLSTSYHTIAYQKDKEGR